VGVISTNQFNIHLSWDYNSWLAFYSEKKTTTRDWIEKGEENVVLTILTARS